MTLRFCLHCNTHHQGRCPKDHRPSSHQRGYGRAWQRLAARAKAAHPWCTWCHATEDLTVDHIDPNSKSKLFLTLEDVQVLCRSCNSKKGRGDRGSTVSTPRRPRARFSRNSLT